MPFGSPSDPNQTAAAEAKLRNVYLILKPHGQSFRRKVRLLLSEAKPSYVYSILKPHSQSSRSQVRLVLSKAKPSYVYSILKPHGQSSITYPSHSKAVVCVSTPRMYPRSGYFLISFKNEISNPDISTFDILLLNHSISKEKVFFSRSIFFL